MKATDADVLEHVRTHDGCTVREVAVAVFGGTGCTRTYERQLAHRAMNRLFDVGAVVRHDGVCKSGVEHRWSVAVDDGAVLQSG